MPDIYWMNICQLCIHFGLVTFTCTTPSITCAGKTIIGDSSPGITHAPVFHIEAIAMHRAFDLALVDHAIRQITHGVRANGRKRGHIFAGVVLRFHHDDVSMLCFYALRAVKLQLVKFDCWKVSFQ